MKRSLVLGLYLLLAEGGGSGQLAQGAVRPAGSLLWLHAGAGSPIGSIAPLTEALAAARPGLTLLVTHEPGVDIGAELFPKGTIVQPMPRDRMPDVRAFLDLWRPDAGLLLGESLPAALICEAHGREVPLIWADAALTPGGVPFWRSGLIASVLTRFSRILARDAGEVSTLQRLGGRSLPIELAGRLEAGVEPLSCNEAEWNDLTTLLRARPVWFAADCPEAEEELVIDAHIHALSHAHRLLLIVEPRQPDRARALAARFQAEGLLAALRADDEVPEPDVQVLIADGPGEQGLWHRLAPVTYLGGTMRGPGPRRSPFEAAALGSAIVHGPELGAQPEAFKRLADARAARQVLSPEQLSAAVAELIAPDKAANLAHAAWSVTSAGVDVAERLVLAVMQTLDKAPAARIAS